MTDHLPWGHRAIARAIYGHLNNHRREGDFEVEYAEIKAETGIANDLYTLLYRFSPSIGRFSRYLAKNKIALEAFSRLIDLNKEVVWRKVAKYRADLIISSYYFHSHSIARWREETGADFKLWTVVADPWTIIPVSFVKEADLNIVYDEVGEKMALENGIKRANILKTGWWVREELYNSKIKDQRSKIRKRLGFYDDRPVIFVGGGSLGTAALAKVLPALMLVKKPVGLIFNTGMDKLGFNMVEEYIKIFRRIRRNDLVKIRCLGWIDNMAEVLSACDIVFGKAGPNFLFDVVAVGKPFVAITHIGGQEDGNIDLIKKKRLGWVKEKSREITRFLLDYLENPGHYNGKYKKEIAREAAINKGSVAKILEKIKIN